MKKIIHKILHRLGFYSGRVVTKMVRNRVYVGLKCGACGKVDEWTKTNF